MENSLANKRPELLSEWSEKNGDLSPESVPYGSNKKYWWNGKCGHEWQASAKARSNGENCPICSNARIIPGINDFASLEPNLLKEWSPKNTIQPTEVGIGSHRKVLWIGKCGHEWSAGIRNRVAGAGCPYCAHKTVLASFNDLESVFPNVAKEWSERNYPLKPSQVTPYANRKVWWRCDKGHEWFTLISIRSYGSKCPYCSGLKLLKGFNDLASRYPQLALEWSQKNDTLLPENVNERSLKNVWWKCSTCGYEYKAVIKSRVHGLNCPACAQRTVLGGYNDLATTDAELAQEWDFDRNIKKPTEVSRVSLYPVWWKGSCGHEWKDKIFNRAVEGAGCIYCEKAFLKDLPYLLVIMYAKQYGLKALTHNETTIGIQLDAIIPELRLAFIFAHKGTEKEKSWIETVRYLCEARKIDLAVIPKVKPNELCIAIKQGFTKAHLFIKSENEKDIEVLRKRYFALKNQRK
jgi:DNA-directed RNA polymerase subunit RPC12/RpoP